MPLVAFTGPTPPRGGPNLSNLGAGLSDIADLINEDKRKEGLNPFFQALAKEFQSGVPRVQVGGETLPGQAQLPDPVTTQAAPQAGGGLRGVLGGMSTESLIDLFTSNEEAFTDPKTLASILKDPDAREQPQLVRELIAANLKPGTPEFRDALLRARGANKPDAEALKSDLIDESGNVKNEVSGEIRRQTVQLFGGVFDVISGRVTGLDPARARQALQMAAGAEELLRGGNVKGISEAVAQVSQGVSIPQPQGSLSEEADRLIERANVQGADTVGLETSEARVTEQINLANATGIGSAAVNIWNNTFGQISPDLVDTDVARARQRLGLLQGDFLVAFNRNPRLPVWEQIRLSRILNSASVWQAPETAREGLRTLDQVLTAEIDDQRSILDGNLPFTMQREALAAIQDLARFRARVRDFNVSNKDTLPAGIPPGSKPIGRTEGGGQVFETPDGRRLVLE